MIIVIAIAVLVLVVVSAFFAGQTGTGFGTITDTASLDQGCAIWRQAQCSTAYADVSIPGYKVNNVQSTLQVACTRVLGATKTESDCKIRCGCPPTTATTP